MTTMIYPSGGWGRARRARIQCSSGVETRDWPPGQRHAEKPTIITSSHFMLTLRASTEQDVPAITAIYGHHVTHGTGTFETAPPTEADMATRRADVLAKGLPYLVAELDGRVLGFAY